MLKLLGVLLTGALLALPAAAQQGYPARAITMIVPFAPGGTSDVIARIVGEEMGRVLGSRLVHENVAGAGGSTALARAAGARPDGYTIVIGNAGTNAAAYTIYPDLRYTPEAFTPIGLVAKTAAVIAVKKDLPAADVADLIALARKSPGAIRLGHAGVGSSNYLICRSFIAAAKVDITLVSYRGAAPALNDAIGGHIDGVCDSATSVAPSIQGGQVRGLVLADTKRSPALPNVPTSAEAGLPDFQAQGWNALFAPAGTPPDVVDRLNRTIRSALSQEKVRQRFAELVSTVPSEEEFPQTYVSALIPREIEKYRKLLSGK